MGEAKRRGTLENRISRMRDEFGVREISEARFNAFVSWTRLPSARQVASELEWFSDHNERVLGLVSLDNFDRDFSFVALGRDTSGKFRCIDLGVSLKSRSDARRALFSAMKALSSTGQSVFPQGDETTGGVDLFTPIVPEAELNPTFRLVKESDYWIPARSILSEMMRHYVDVDGNFVQQFQTTGFDARLWELYLFAYLLEDGLYVDRPDPAPDFRVQRGRDVVFIEAVTVNPTNGDAVPQPTEQPAIRTPEEVAAILKGKMPIKFGSALYSKLTRKTPYWSLPHVIDHPLVFAIADFHEAQSMTWSSPALFQYLYGVNHEFLHDANGQLIISTLKVDTHEYEGKKIPSGFFYQPNAEHVSAVLFTASGTLSKFNRMGRLAGFATPKMRTWRYGLCHHHDPNSALPRQFVHEVEPGMCTETWGEGISMFHNPNAKFPVPPEVFPSIAHHWFASGVIKSSLPEFHPYTSMTLNLIEKDQSPDTQDMRSEGS